MIINGFMSGLSAGIFCMGYCYPALGPLLFSLPRSSWRDSAWCLGIFLSGRLLAYVLVGSICGIAGRSVPEISGFLQKAVPFLHGALGVFLISYGAFSFFNHARWCRYFAKNLKRSLFLAGVITGINICPPFLIAILAAVSFSDIGRSILYFLSFFIATALWMVPLVIIHYFSRKDEVRRAARIIAVTCGIWFVYQAICR